MWALAGIGGTALILWADAMVPISRECLQLQVVQGQLLVHRLLELCVPGELLIDAPLASVQVAVREDTLLLTHPGGRCEVRPSDPAGAAAWLIGLRDGAVGQP